MFKCCSQKCIKKSPFITIAIIFAKTFENDSSIHFNDSTLKKMFNQDEGKIECVVGNREMGFGRARKPRMF